jgi:hypothetical protein
MGSGSITGRTGPGIADVAMAALLDFGYHAPLPASGGLLALGVTMLLLALGSVFPCLELGLCSGCCCGGGGCQQGRGAKDPSAVATRGGGGQGVEGAGALTLAEEQEQMLGFDRVKRHHSAQRPPPDGEAEAEEGYRSLFWRNRRRLWRGLMVLLLVRLAYGVALLLSRDAIAEVGVPCICLSIWPCARVPACLGCASQRHQPMGSPV